MPAAPTDSSRPWPTTSYHRTHIASSLYKGQLYDDIEDDWGDKDMPGVSLLASRGANLVGNDWAAEPGLFPARFNLFHGDWTQRKMLSTQTRTCGAAPAQEDVLRDSELLNRQPKRGKDMQFEPAHCLLHTLQASVSGLTVRAEAKRARGKRGLEVEPKAQSCVSFYKASASSVSREFTTQNL